MLINRIVLCAGQIADRQVLDTTRLDSALFAEAQSTLLKLREGAPCVDVRVGNDTTIRVLLGLVRDVLTENHLREKWFKDHPTGDSAEYEQIHNETHEHHRRTNFTIKHRAREVIYDLILNDTRPDDPGVFGSVAGSSIGADLELPPDKRSTLTLDEEIEIHKRVAEEIVSHKPAFVTIISNNDERTLFADYFACAMLLADQEEA